MLTCHPTDFHDSDHKDDNNIILQLIVRHGNAYDYNRILSLILRLTMR